MSSQKFAKVLLWLNAAVWLTFGVGYTVAPSAFAWLVGVTISRLDGVRVMTDVGVMMVGISLWYGYCALDDSRTRLGLVSAMLIGIGLCAGRLIGIAMTGSANPVSVGYAGLEALNAVLLVVAVRADARLRVASATEQ